MRRSESLIVAFFVCVSALMTHRLQAQWSASPVIALGPSIPTGAMGSSVSYGGVIKAGLWMRAPKVPVGLTVEGLYTQFGINASRTGTGDSRIGALTANVTTRRHQRRLELYGVVGGGWYWHDGPIDPFPARQAAGINVGVGEVIALGARDYFAELRLHAIRTPARTGEGWMSFMPLVLGVRF